TSPQPSRLLQARSKIRNGESAMFTRFLRSRPWGADPHRQVLLFDVLHPAHVHFFAYVAQRMRDGGGEVHFAARNKDVTVQLLQAYGFPHEVLSTMGGGPAGLALELATRSVAVTRLAARLRPALMLGIMGPVIAPVGRLTRTPSWVFYDTETAKLTNVYAFPLATRVFVPDSYSGKTPAHTTRYRG